MKISVKFACIYLAYMLCNRPSGCGTGYPVAQPDKGWPSVRNIYIIYYVYILYIYIYLYHDGATLQSELPWYITDTLPMVVYFTLMFDILPACG